MPPDNPPQGKLILDFPAISNRLRELDFPPVDLVVGILRGGLVPAFLVAQQLGGLPVKLLGIRYRDDANQPMLEEPEPTLPLDRTDLRPGSRILLVDDVSVSGKTVGLARRELEGFRITTFALKGRAHIVAFPEIKGCVKWPWNPE